MTNTTPATDPATLRAEHDTLARRLEIRRSVDHVRRGAYLGFGALIGVCLAAKLAWDRWGAPPGVATKVHVGAPLFFLLAAAAALVLVALAARDVRRARRLMREEDALFARFRAIRAALRLDP